MSEEADFFKEKLTNFNKKQALWVGFTLLVVLVGLGYFGIYRPVIIMDADHVAGIYVKNKGGMDALIYKVDGFWYWAGQVAMLANIPDIHQRVGPGADPVRLQIPDIPILGKQVDREGRCYMKLAIRYKVPGIPIFRYTTPLYFEYAPDLKSWTATINIPPKYRVLGNLAMGNIEKVELNFPCERPR